MKFSATWMIALRALRRNLMRTGLTMLGIIIGVAAVIAMVAIGTGAREQVAASIAQIGQNTILVMSGATSRGGVRGGWGSAPTLTRQDYEAIREEIPGVIRATPDVRKGAQVMAGNQNVNTSVNGAGEDFVEIRAWGFAEGGNFSALDIKTKAKVAILGQTVATNLFGDASPVGQVVRIQNVPYQVVGLLKPKGMSMMGSDQDDVVLVPWTSALVRLTGTDSFRAITVQVESAEMVEQVMADITALLRQRHKIRDEADDDFHVRSQQEIMEMATATAKTMTILLGAIAGVSLLVGGIGIMNIMLVSVTERTREIGVRMAVGARGSDILLQFLVEAVVLSVGGGLLGIGLGFGVAQLVSAELGWNTLVSPQSVALAFLFSAAIGIFFGFYPARKAAGLDPIEALRYE
ncbi:MAG TPA: ABC transporter permease [Kiritimatiellia bacterium]|jgi:putative ABC transport system permease protein|nr:ABC transporter permease [Kiritimatiellia bacterium]MBP9571589.1 ABC transporter permease [Kiritimatiellia bacterium]HOR75001.1 ABC transporter permease [Kiritimatiellia bacterium]HQF19809.1 ABC transporter permease [Kiritimatiellia bacterium]HQG74025.1 ABC transporter permease [Kiritimatiellia bacterium]